MDTEDKLTDKAICCCKKLPYVIHALSQSLFIIQAYASGFLVRINEDNINLTELSEVLKKINQQVDSMGTIIHSMTSDKMQ